MTSRKKTDNGLQGENQAAGYLCALGYEILERRFRAGRGEVDIIAREGDTLVFVEVKAWRSLAMIDLEYSLTTNKRAKILSAAQSFLSSRNYKTEETSLRFDVIFIGHDGVQHFRSAWHFDGGA